MALQCETEVPSGQQLFGHAQLGHQRRTNRLVKCFDLIRRHPGGTLPHKFKSPADLRGLYRLCNSRHVTHAAVIGAARQYTFERILAHAGPVLLIHDATELDYTSITSLTDELGQIGNGQRRGFICQNVLAVAADTGQVLGILDQLLHCRDELSQKETLAEHRARQTRESLLWLRGTEYLPADAQLIDVADQGADTFEFLEHEHRSGRRFVVRAHYTRKIYAGHEASGPRHELKQYARDLPELGRFVMDVQAQRGRKGRKQAEFVLRGGPVLVCRPHAQHGNHGNDPLPLYVVQVTELKPPKGEKAIDWTLLTNEPVMTFNDAWRVTGWYERRWIVEEFHKAQKTGCQVEDMQFTTAAGLGPAIALLSIVALTLLDLRHASRQPDAHTRCATRLFAAEYVEVLSAWRYRKIRSTMTVHEFFYALARLGGHQNRKRDHQPGWLILWRGWMTLQSMLDGFHAALLKRSGQT
jgi:Transposase DNA-binding